MENDWKKRAGHGTLHSGGRIQGQKARRFWTAMAIIILMALFIIIQGWCGRGTDTSSSPLEAAARRMDAGLDSLIRAQGYDAYTVTLRGEVEEYTENMASHYRYNLFRLHLFISNAEETGDTAGLAEARELERQMAELDCDTLMRTSFIRWVTWTDSLQNTHSFLQDLEGDRLTARFTDNFN